MMKRKYEYAANQSVFTIGKSSKIYRHKKDIMKEFGISYFVATRWIKNGKTDEDTHIRRRVLVDERSPNYFK